MTASPPPASEDPGPPGSGSSMRPEDERMWGMLAHVSALVAAALALAFLGPLVVLLLQGNRSPFVRRQAVEALNFQITLYLAVAISALLIFVLIGLVLLPLVLLAWVILTIVGAVAAYGGKDYRYPVNLRLVK